VLGASYVLMRNSGATLTPEFAVLLLTAGFVVCFVVALVWAADRG
jgi:hypothetical protein